MAHATASLRDRWWIIGSAALVLHGLDPGEVGDVDLLTSADDAATMLRAHGLPVASGVADDRFRSAVFGQWRVREITVETMGGFEVRALEGWRPVIPMTREPIAVEGTILYVPSRTELATLLRRFGRSKDIARAALLG